MAKSLIGIVSSTKSDKTITVTVEYQMTHPIYKKQYKKTKKFLAHDQNNQAKEGDKVLITETRPLSRRKRHTLTKILEHASLTKEESAVLNEDVSLTGDKS